MRDYVNFGVWVIGEKPDDVSIHLSAHLGLLYATLCKAEVIGREKTMFRTMRTPFQQQQYIMQRKISPGNKYACINFFSISSKMTAFWASTLTHSTLQLLPEPNKWRFSCTFPPIFKNKYCPTFLVSLTSVCRITFGGMY